MNVFENIYTVRQKTINERAPIAIGELSHSPYIPFNKSPTAIYMCSPTFNKVLSTELLLSKYVNINATC